MPRHTEENSPDLSIQNQLGRYHAVKWNWKDPWSLRLSADSCYRIQHALAQRGKT